MTHPTAMNDLGRVGSLLRERREALHISKLQLSARTGLKSETIHDLETGRRETTLGTLRLIATSLGYELWLEGHYEGKRFYRGTNPARLLQRAREKAGLVQTTVEGLTGIDGTEISQQQLSGYETGRTVPMLSTIRRLMTLYGTELVVKVQRPKQ